MTRADIYKLISDERNRQQVKFGDRSIAGPLTHYHKFTILGEEVGEVAEAIQRVETEVAKGTMFARVDLPLAHLRDELVQVAACAVAWLESL